MYNSSISKRIRKRLPSETVPAEITDLSHEGRGIAHINGKATFVFGGLPGETVQLKYTAIHKQFDEAIATDVLFNPSPNRTTPPCPHVGICGGCSLQHMQSEAQRIQKQKILLEHFQHQANCQPKEILPPLLGNTLGYRRKARLSVRFVPKKESVLIGFRERGSSFVAQIDQCEVLHPSVGYKIKALRNLFMQLEKKYDIPQLEIAIGDINAAVIIRHLSALSDHDLQLLITFARDNHLDFYLQPKGVESIHPLYPEQPNALFYSIPAHHIKMFFKPEHFTQVNTEINLQMIDRAIALLALEKTDYVLDLFCGIGNFSLPIAKYCKQVIGIEGSACSVLQAQKNAIANKISNVTFYTQDLTQDFSNISWTKNHYDKILLDPARTGAKEILPYIAIWKPKRVVYVSCNPITLARDTAQLLALGYTLEKAGIMDMFPHTTHVEAIAVFQCTC